MLNSTPTTLIYTFMLCSTRMLRLTLYLYIQHGARINASINTEYFHSNIKVQFTTERSHLYSNAGFTTVRSHLYIYNKLTPERPIYTLAGRAH